MLHDLLMAGRYEDALIQNEIANIFEDDFSAVGEEDGAAGGRKENVITEQQSFTDLTYSKGKVISFIQWLPHRKVTYSLKSSLTQSGGVCRLPCQTRLCRCGCGITITNRYN